MTFKNTKGQELVINDLSNLENLPSQGYKLPMYAKVPFEEYALKIEKDGTLTKFRDVAKCNAKRIMKHIEDGTAVSVDEIEEITDKDNKVLAKLFK